MTTSSIETYKHVLSRFPSFELSYETISHNKVPSNYNVCIAIPAGRKHMLWFTYDPQSNTDVCYLLEIGKNKKIINIELCNLLFDPLLSLGTILYGTIVENTKIFTIEDVYYYKGNCIHNLVFGEKLGFAHEMASKYIFNDISIQNILVYFPVMWGVYEPCEYVIPSNYAENIGYAIKNIQYRGLNEIIPYLNVYPKKAIVDTSVSTKINPEIFKFYNVKYKMDFSKPQYKYPTIFFIKPALQNDIYNLFAYGKNKELVFYNIAYIPSYKTSVFMNSIFRNIKENKNIDYIEESDDEDDFQNTDIDKYVDLQKHELIECVFNSKFKKWVPMRAIDRNKKVVHISALVSNYFY